MNDSNNGMLRFENLFQVHLFTIPTRRQSQSTVTSTFWYFCQAIIPMYLPNKNGRDSMQ
ncbi:hypothetical protein [Argonema galeatum]|uniref:hypothetical protein n=1 Tax=Argonema galeatum TaxID=2942762 RepID=UPI0020124FCC|nr:hypothetical protein [Argonema galeatum]